MHEIRKPRFSIAYDALTDPSGGDAQWLLSADFTVFWVCMGRWDITIEANHSRIRTGTLVMKRSDEQAVVWPCDSDRCRIFMIGIWGRIPRQEGFPPYTDLYDQLLARPAGRDNVFSRTAIARQVLSAPVWHLMTLDQCGYSHTIKEELAIKNVYHILTGLCRLLSHQLPEKPCQSVVKRVMAYVDLHFAEELSAKRLGELFFLSPNHLMAVFKAETGVSLHQYMTERRMGKAEQLMEQGMGVTQVGYQVGYKSYQGFYQAYCRHTGRTPGAFIADLKSRPVTVSGEQDI